MSISMTYCAISIATIVSISISSWFSISISRPLSIMSINRRVAVSRVSITTISITTITIETISNAMSISMSYSTIAIATIVSI